MKNQPIQVKIDLWDEDETKLWGTTDHDEFYKIFKFPKAPLIQIGDSIEFNGRKREIKNIYFKPCDSLMRFNHDEDLGIKYPNNMHIIVVIDYKD